MIEWVLALLLALGAGAPAAPGELDRVAFAVEGAESSWGADRAMWRRDPAGPQGPMQVGRAAALDVRAGNRFDIVENRAIGRAYLAAMFRRYGNWPDAVVAYNWGPANLDRWIAAGRPSAGLAAPIRLYLDRVMGQLRASARLPASASGTAPASGAPPRIVPVVIPQPDPPEFKDAKLRKAYLRDAAAIGRLQEFLAAAQPDGAAASPMETPDTAAVLQTIRAIAERPGFEEFRAMPAARRQAQPSLPGLREIARVLIGKLQQDSAALVLVDEARQRRRPR